MVWESITNLVSAFLGAGIIVWWDRRKQKVERLERLRSLLVSIRTELDTLWNRYNTGIGMQIEKIKEGEIFNNVYLASEEYFTIYNSSASLIGQLSDNNLVILIVSIYTKAKGFVDVFRINNAMLSRRDNLQLMNVTQNQIAILMLQQVEQSLRYIAGQLKIHHNDLNVGIRNLFENLDNAIKSNML